jgi:hypothetical protein
MCGRGSRGRLSVAAGRKTGDRAQDLHDAARALGRRGLRFAPEPLDDRLDCGDRV